MAAQQPNPRSSGAVTSATAAKTAAGVLPVPAAALNKTSSSNTPSRPTPRPPAPRLKLILRRLPPGLTQDEFTTALGDEWKVGAGKVEWFAYKEGKISKEYV